MEGAFEIWFVEIIEVEFGFHSYCAFTMTGLPLPVAKVAKVVPSRASLRLHVLCAFFGLASFMWGYVFSTFPSSYQSSFQAFSNMEQTSMSTAN